MLRSKNKTNSRAPLSIPDMTSEQLEAELLKGVDSICAGKVRTPDEVDEILHRELGI